MTEHLETRLQHHIQRDIVHKLVSLPTARFRDLKPQGLESNIFMYHLNKLIAGEFVQKTTAGYELTPAGKHFADRVNLESLKLRIQPKLITILMISHGDDQWLLLERLHQPFIGTKGFPSGKIHYGEALDDAARRELKEKSNLDNVELRLRGSFIMRFFVGKEVVNHIIGYVFCGKLATGLSTDYKTDLFRSYVGEESELFGDKTFSGHRELLELISKHEPDDLFVSQHDFLSDY